MKVIVNRDDALRVIAPAASIASRKSTIPILTSLLVSAEGELLNITGTDLDRQATSACLAQVDEPGAVAVSAARFHEFVNALPPGAQLMLRHEPPEPRLEVVCGRSKCRIPTLPAADFPVFTPLPAEAGGGMLSAKLLDWMLGKVGHAMHTQVTRANLYGIHLALVVVDGSRKLRAVAVDGFMLGWVDVDAPEGLTDFAPIIIPRPTVPEIHRLLNNIDEQVELRSDGAVLMIRVGDCSLASKLIDGEFPDYQRVTPRDHPNEARVKKASLEGALKRLRVVQDDNKAIVEFQMAGDSLRLAARSFEAGQVDDEIDVEASADVAGGFNAKNLATTLSQVAGDDLVIRYGTGKQPFTFHEPQDPRVILLCSPTTV